MIYKSAVFNFQPFLSKLLTARYYNTFSNVFNIVFQWPLFHFSTVKPKQIFRTNGKNQASNLGPMVS